MGIARTRPAMKTSDEIYLAYFLFLIIYSVIFDGNKEKFSVPDGYQTRTFLPLEGCDSHFDSYFSIFSFNSVQFGSFLAKWTQKLPMFGIMTSFCYIKSSVEVRYPHFPPLPL